VELKSEGEVRADIKSLSLWTLDFLALKGIRKLFMGLWKELQSGFVQVIEGNLYNPVGKIAKKIV